MAAYEMKVKQNLAQNTPYSVRLSEPGVYGERFALGYQKYTSTGIWQKILSENARKYEFRYYRFSDCLDTLN
ncbi:hypothetical protein ACFL0M_06085 [Thermodesulfobacteriota bacterium]